MDDPICKLCGHSAEHHRFANPVECRRCPDRACQDGPNGERYREELAEAYGIQP